MYIKVLCLNIIVLFLQAREDRSFPIPVKHMGGNDEI